jgi:uncharacterized protein YciI
MTQLYLGLLRKGPTWTAEETPELAQAQRRHLALLQHLGDEGDLLIAGPIPGGEDLRGILVCHAESTEQARSYFAQDAHIQSGRLLLEIYPWMVPTEVLGRPLMRDQPSSVENRF